MWAYAVTTLSVCLRIPLHYLLHPRTNLYEAWYMYHGTRVHLNVVLHKSFPSVCVSVWVSPYHYEVNSR
jgi:hypothetical protein